eukprot:s64_g2.t1
MVDGSESTVSDIAQIRSSKLHGIYFSGRCKGSLTINKSNRKLHRFSTEIPGLLIQSVFRSAFMIPGSISISWNPVLIQSAEHRATSEFFIDRSQAEKWRALSSTCQERFCVQVGFTKMIFWQGGLTLKGTVLEDNLPT